MPFSWRHSLLLAALAALHTRQAHGSPPINVDLQAAFGSAPFLIELLETAAEEKADVYFPLLDRIADGRFDGAETDQQLYSTFTDVLRDDGLVTNAQSLSSFKLALSVRNTAPRIEAHYHYYNTTVLPSLGGEAACDTWVERAGKQFCEAGLDKEEAGELKGLGADLPFDRVLGPEGVETTTLYADLGSPAFKSFHRAASKAARDGKARYRVRYKPSASHGVARPLVVSGYGVELALKRTDYIVIDDRNKDDSKEAEAAVTTDEAELDDDDQVADLKPLTANEVSGLALKAAEYVARSAHPLDTLLKVTQDFPKHSYAIAQRNGSDAFREEFFANREQFLPSGFNVIWINGAQYDPRKVDVFSLLDHMRRERRLLEYFRETGLKPGEAIRLMSHPSIMETFTKQQGARYDWRDEIEGGNVILWLNDLEKDKRYKEWPVDLTSLLQRMFPGQMPSLRRDMFNAIVPIDFSRPASIKVVSETILGLIKRKIALRWGVVPITATKEAEQHARIIHHLQETYGLVAAMDYLEKIADSSVEILAPVEAVLTTVVEKRTPKEGKVAMSFAEIIESEELDSRIQKARAYLSRLGADKSEDAPFFINGVAGKQDEEWLQLLSQQVSADLRVIQRGVYEGSYDDDVWLPGVFINGSSTRRNSLIVPEDEKAVSLVNLHGVLDAEHVKGFPQIQAKEGIAAVETALLLVIADFDTDRGLELAHRAVAFRSGKENVHVVFVHNPKSAEANKALQFLSLYKSANGDLEKLTAGLKSLISGPDEPQVTTKDAWPSTPQLQALKLKAGDHALVLDSRKLGPLAEDVSLTVGDLDLLYEYEERRRLGPARKALEELKLESKIKDSTDAAVLLSLLAVSSVSDLPEGIFETPPQVRTDIFYEWKDELTSFTVGDNSTAVIQLVVALDPASETAQQWAPILKVLTELDGVSLRVYLNPKDLQEELPVKRFYRYVLESEPKFGADGSIQGGAAEFKAIPEQALLTLGMDVPAAWVVTSKNSIHDLDNIKLSSLPANGKVDATYELEYILIEGHSREHPLTTPPSGVQLVLSTPENARIADTIIMANLGYFQFKANPGHYNISLKAGRSRQIYDIQSAGGKGYDPQPGDETTEASLLSFQGVTLYPRIARKPGKENEEVLEPAAAKPDLVQQGADFVGTLLSKTGLRKDDQSAGTKHADINIFSVASGHLYERMLNIMMVSVMRHTKHTVKFWFIEQFLSPSFKAFLPSMAAEYGFQYEMVTYKWPHWLRAQKEKQREIWGYKILFLDVLFPLDLDKVIFVDADQIVRTDMQKLNDVDLEGAPYGFTPMCDSRVEMEGFRFWKQGYWKTFLRGLPYHISALYVVDLKRFRQMAAGDRLRQQYHTLSADPASLANLDQDLPNNMQMLIPIHSLSQEWLWCETWCSDEALAEAKTIDLCNNPLTKEPKLERARRQVPEWTEYDDEIAGVARRTAALDAAAGGGFERPVGGVQEDELAGKPEGGERAASAEVEEEGEEVKTKKKHDEL